MRSAKQPIALSAAAKTTAIPADAAAAAAAGSTHETKRVGRGPPLSAAAGAVAGRGGRGGAAAEGRGGWGVGLLTPPRWVPDEETTSCAGCGKDFDWARRRVRIDNAEVGSRQGREGGREGGRRKEKGIFVVIVGGRIFFCFHWTRL